MRAQARMGFLATGPPTLDEIMDLILFINTTNVRQICYNICPFIKDDKYKTNLM